jgi:hypothetical protein
MKKCKVSLSGEETKTKYFYLFPESSLLHSLVANSEKKNIINLLKKHPEVETVSLRRGQWLEVEWNGCHIDYSKPVPTSVSFLRLIKATMSPKRKNDGSLISVHFGWILTDHLRLIEGEKSGIQIKSLHDEDEQFNFEELFQDNETIEDLIKKSTKENIV